MADQKKRTDVPLGWKNRPDDWWAHVRVCTGCAEFYEDPSPKHQPPLDLDEMRDWMSRRVFGSDLRDRLARSMAEIERLRDQVKAAEPVCPTCRNEGRVKRTSMVPVVNSTPLVPVDYWIPCPNNSWHWRGLHITGD